MAVTSGVSGADAYDAAVAGGVGGDGGEDGHGGVFRGGGLRGRRRWVVGADEGDVAGEDE